MKFKSLTLATMILGLGLFMVSGCSDDDNGVASPEVSNVKVVHASPDAPGVDILIDNSKAVSNLEFPNNTGYVNLESGTRNVKVNAAGTDVTVINEDLTLTPNMTYSVFAVDSLSRITVLVLADDLTTPASGKAHVRFIHLSPNAPAVDIAVTGGPVVFSDYVFKEYSAFTPLDAGTYNLEVRLSGTSTVVLPLPGIQLQNGKIYTVFARGFVGGSGNQALGAEIIVNN